jgi:hypothetical protein
MALHWNVSKVADGDSVCWETAEADIPMRGIEKGKQYLAPVTNALIWSTIAVGLGSITAENAELFADRLTLWERVFGTMLSNADGSVPLTEADVRRHIGLSTNVSKETDAQWAKKLVETWRRNRAYDREAEARKAREAEKREPYLSTPA